MMQFEPRRQQHTPDHRRGIDKGMQPYYRQNSRAGQHYLNKSYQKASYVLNQRPSPYPQKCYNNSYNNQYYNRNGGNLDNKYKRRSWHQEDRPYNNRSYGRPHCNEAERRFDVMQSNSSSNSWLSSRDTWQKDGFGGSQGHGDYHKSYGNPRRWSDGGNFQQRHQHHDQGPNRWNNKWVRHRQYREEGEEVLPQEDEEVTFKKRRMDGMGSKESSPSSEKENNVGDASSFYGKGRERKFRFYSTNKNSPRQPLIQVKKRGLLADELKSGSKVLQLCGGQSESRMPVKLVGASPTSQKHPAERGPVEKHLIGFPNFGNTCYLNATLQSLFGLVPFTEDFRLFCHADVTDNSLIGGLSNILSNRQKGQQGEVNQSLRKIKQTMENIDNSFTGSKMQDANEFLLRLLDTLKDDIDKVLSVPAAASPGGSGSDADERTKEKSASDTINPVRQNFEFQLMESYSCTSCGETVGKKQEYFSLFVDVPRGREDPPTLQDALSLYMKPETRELKCTRCSSNQCDMVPSFTKLPRVLVLQLKRYVYLSELQKIRKFVRIPKFLTLHEHTMDSTVGPIPWTQAQHCKSSGDSSNIPSQSWNMSAGNTGESGDHKDTPMIGPLPETAGDKELQEAMRLSIEEEDQRKDKEEEELQEAIRRSLQQTEEEEELDEVMSDSSTASMPCGPVDDSADHTYHLTSIVSHYGPAANNGHYVADVYVAKHKTWFHYDDESVKPVSEQMVLSEGRQQNGYIFFYVHKDVCKDINESDQVKHQQC